MDDQVIAEQFERILYSYNLPHDRQTLSKLVDVVKEAVNTGSNKNKKEVFE